MTKPCSGRPDWWTPRASLCRRRRGRSSRPQRRRSSKRPGLAGFCALTLYNQGGWTFLNWGWQAGAEFERQSSEKWTAAFDEPQAVQALQFIKDLRWKYDALQPDVRLDANKSFEMMGKHECGMAMVVPDWLGQALAQPGSTLKLEDIGLTTLPAGPAGRESVLGAGFNTINAHASPEVQRAALAWGMWSAFDPAALEIGLAQLGNGAPFGFMTRSLMFRPNSPTVQKERALLAKFRDFPYYKTYLEEAAQDARPEPPSRPKRCTLRSIRRSWPCWRTRTQIRRRC